MELDAGNLCMDALKEANFLYPEKGCEILYQRTQVWKWSGSWLAIFG